MLVKGQLIKTKVNSTTFKHYNNLGYNVRANDEILVPPEHLPYNSHEYVNVICDICGRVIKRTYQEYNNRHTYNLDTCANCKYEKAKRTNIDKYGCNSPQQNPDVAKKTRQTCMDKYGVDCVFKSKDIQEKIKQTNLELYGVENPFSSEEIKQKIYNTNIDKYGVPFTQQSLELRQKSQQTYMDKYGVKNPMQNQTIKENAIKTMCSNGLVPTSKQQIELHNLIKHKYSDAILNYPYSTCSLDIYIEINGIKIDCEYDAKYWHKNQQRDIRRDKFLQENGFKILRIRSGRLLPTEEELFSAIDYLINTEHHFKEIILSDWKENIKKEGEYNGK